MTHGLFAGFLCPYNGIFEAPAQRALGRVTVIIRAKYLPLCVAQNRNSINVSYYSLLINKSHGRMGAMFYK